MKHIKPILKLESPHPHVDAKKQPLNFLQRRLFYNFIGLCSDPKYKMVKETYRAISTMNRGLIDKREPKSFPLIGKLSENKHENNHDIKEHIKNIESLHRRIKRIQIGKIEDRKKNPLDIIAHPSLFFRTKEDYHDLVSKTSSTRDLVSIILNNRPRNHDLHLNAQKNYIKENA